MTHNEALTKAALAFLPRQYRKTIELIADEPLTNEELAEKLKTSNEYARRILYNLHREKVACVVHWRRTSCNGVHTKLWGLGVKDERQPPKLTPSERSARYRASKKNTSGEVRLGIWGL